MDPDDCWKTFGSQHPWCFQRIAASKHTRSVWPLILISTHTVPLLWLYKSQRDTILHRAYLYGNSDVPAVTDPPARVPCLLLSVMDHDGPAVPHRHEFSTADDALFTGEIHAMRLGPVCCCWARPTRFGWV
jgi:hypothetical protein